MQNPKLQIGSAKAPSDRYLCLSEGTKPLKVMTGKSRHLSGQIIQRHNFFCTMKTLAQYCQISSVAFCQDFQT